MLITIDQNSVEAVEECCISVTSWPSLLLYHSFLCDGELWKDYLDVLRSEERVCCQSLDLLRDLLMGALKAVFGCICVTAARFDLVVHPVHQGANAGEVGVCEEGLILDEVLDLVPVVSLEGLVLQLLQVTFIELLESHVLVVRWFEEAFSRTPFNRVTQLEVAHALLLHPLDPQTLQSLLVLDR